MSAGPDTWGPHGWKFIHFIALGYPTNPDENDKQKYKTFFYLFGDMIPCSICANHYKKNLSKHDISLYLDSRTKMLEWTILMHNEVNKSNGKKIYTFEEGIKMIINGQQPIKCTEDFSNTNTNIYDNYNKNYTLIMFLVFIIILLLLYIYKRNLI